MSQSFYITTAISYPNGKPHIGHAYEAIAADALARYHRLLGQDVYFQTGTDEHGLKMDQAARNRDVKPITLADEMSSHFKAMDDLYNISYDRFIRTTEAEHYKASQALWKTLADAGHIYLGRYEGWYSVRDEAFYKEDELITDAAGNKLSPQGTPVEWNVEESWFFRLSDFQDKLLAYYEAHPKFIQPEARRNEVISFVKSGLSDLSISRSSFDWGIPVPDAPGHVMYVWIDALTNYLTGAGYPDNQARLEHYWPADIHIIGKDIIRFHAVYWPAFLMAANIPLPKAVFGHGFLLNKGEKMSKSVGNVVDPIDMAKLYGVDQLRYFLLREVTFGQDGSYSHEAIVNRINADLANDFGNLAQRSLSMIAKNGAKVPTPYKTTAADETLMTKLAGIPHQVATAMNNIAPNQALDAIWRGVAEANLYISEQAPWTVRKTDPERADTILYWTAEAVRQLAILSRWAIPNSSDALLDQLGQGADQRDFAALSSPLVPSLALPAPQGVFPRFIDEDKVSSDKKNAKKTAKDKA
ncbi:MAG: methionine--tRNA ligase [Zymomonas mobilis subsp. pomaceae]|uniref:Methionine--tRNA ligase n=1 Tax=Zymomonas mobilis subsp. pomaceae (strain ATCC 29192 / DSM 22645 / JCM 10191 / CCUG 17912 / NBRC 13757 / NCIMB 11200 / NRRL B-4491 / Barker I) TaxID=579138 RepID=F8EU20_ZYMMT|nr:methionine--tRNA ligase [Zymomonas mobilis]AEI37100.1 methionyl-tRNA synthetase [Zymomonas mobilis subsp. pomaceae ATCC 29192]MDX5948471.1 methionine--tRNA ligase [Zymomonas mobilis subsp. pomaceae]GEB89464.1 methionine--tRNA ligase [Zymomonas mobilis subsp. pomaceae]